MMEQRRMHLWVEWNTHGLMGFTTWKSGVVMTVDDAEKIVKLAGITGVGTITFTQCMGCPDCYFLLQKQEADQVRGVNEERRL